MDHILAMEHLVNSSEEFIRALNNKIVIFYFSSESCAVCRSFLPQFKSLLESQFPEIDFYQIHSELNTALCADNMVFTFPTILIFVNGKETLRFSRIIPLSNVRDALDRLRILLSD